MRSRTTAEWLDILREKDVPSAAYNRLEDLLEDPHLAAVGFFQKEEHPTEGTIRRTAVPNRFSGGMREDALPAPRVGEHTREILQEAGLDEERIDGMIAAGVAAAPARREA